MEDPQNNSSDAEQPADAWSSTAEGDRSVAARDIHGEVITGDTIHIRMPPLTPIADVQAPSNLNNLPSRPQIFVGHGHVLEQLDSRLRVQGADNVHVISGLGGIGKTTLAARWAADQTGRGVVWWITADTSDRIEHGLSRLAVALQPELEGAFSRQTLSLNPPLN